MQLVNCVFGYALQYPEGYLEAVAAKEKEKENKDEDEVDETPTKGKRKRKSQAGKCSLFNWNFECCECVVHLK